MTLINQSLWKRLIAKVAITAFLFQAVVSVFGCGPAALRLAAGVSRAPSSQSLSLSGKNAAVQVATICAASSFKQLAAYFGGAPTGGSDDAPQHECPICALHCCHTSAVTTTEAVLLPALPIVSTTLVFEAAQPLTGADRRAFRNRDPPALALI